jgi:hypothetical protein
MMSAKELNRRLDELRRRQEDEIERHGRTRVGVFSMPDAADPTNETFVYTVGNALRGLPEFLIVGMCDDQGILNHLSDMMLERRAAFADRELVTLAPGYMPLCVVDASEDVKDKFTVQATNLLGGDYRVQQVVLSDKAGLFPWQSGCAAPYCNVVIHRAVPLN